MKNFQTIEFDTQTYERELNEYEQLLQDNHALTEQNQILPFFRERPFLASRIALLVPELFKFNLNFHIVLNMVTVKLLTGSIY